MTRAHEPHPTPTTTRLASLSGVALLVATATTVPSSSGTISDPDANRVIMSMVGLLVVLGVGLALVTVWFWRSSRPDHPVLGPLEVMGDAKFWRANKVEQLHRLDEARPPGAEPERAGARHIVASRPLVDPEEIDLELASSEEAISFDDLVEPQVADPVPPVIPDVPDDVQHEAQAEPADAVALADQVELDEVQDRADDDAEADAPDVIADEADAIADAPDVNADEAQQAEIDDEVGESEGLIEEVEMAVAPARNPIDPLLGPPA